MGIVSSNISGAPFNGGTITGALVIDTTGNNNATPLTIRLSKSGINPNMLTIHSVDGGGQDIVYVDDTGVLFVDDGTNNTRIAANRLLAQYPSVQLDVGSTGVTVAGTGADVGLFGHAIAAQPTVTSGTVTAAQLATALQSYGALGGT